MPTLNNLTEIIQTPCENILLYWIPKRPNLEHWRIQWARNISVDLRRPTWRTGHYARAAQWTRSRSTTTAKTLCATSWVPWRRTCCPVHREDSERGINIHTFVHVTANTRIMNNHYGVVPNQVKIGFTSLLWNAGSNAEQKQNLKESCNLGFTDTHDIHRVSKNCASVILWITPWNIENLLLI